MTRQVSPTTGYTSNPADCPRCGGSGEIAPWFWMSPANAWACPLCDGTGVAPDIACDWCREDCAPADAVTVRDWTGRADTICPECWRAAQADPATHGDAERVDGGEAVIGPDAPDGRAVPVMRDWRTFQAPIVRDPRTGGLLTWRVGAAIPGYYAVKEVA